MLYKDWYQCGKPKMEMINYGTYYEYYDEGVLKLKLDVKVDDSSIMPCFMLISCLNGRSIGTIVEEMKEGGNSNPTVQDILKAEFNREGRKRITFFVERFPF